MTHRLIFVCEANICRSPLMEQALRARVDAELWEITSAGTRVGPGDLPMCEVSAEIAAASGADIAAAAHRSTAIDLDELQAADLVLTASRAERSVVAQLAPDARARTFTLREAVHLGADPLHPDELAAVAAFSAASPADDLATYAAALHRRRGFVTPPSTGRVLFGKRRPHPLDIPDAHHGSAKEHRAMLERTALDIAELERQVGAFLVPPVAGRATH